MFCKVRSIPDPLMEAKIDYLERTRDVEVDKLRLQNLADGWTQPKLRVSGAELVVGGRKTDPWCTGRPCSTVAREQRLMKEEIQKRKLLESIGIVNTVFKVKQIN